jgi:hypothetical protein
MNYAILRLEKSKTMSNIGVRAAHNMRSSEGVAPHADPTKRGQNIILVGPADAADVVAKFAERLASAGKYRKDAVRAVEVLVSASPEFFDEKVSDAKQSVQWRDCSIRWVNETFGVENVVSAVLHFDERTPHIQILLTPINEGKLRASHWLDGPGKLAKLQDSYAKSVRQFGLRRGEKGSNSNHVSLSEFYALGKRTVAAVPLARRRLGKPNLPKRGLFGRVSDTDWENFSIQLDRYVQSVGKQIDEAVVLSEFAGSKIGIETNKRLLETRERAARLERELAALEVSSASARGQLSSLDNNIQLRKSELMDLDRQVMAKREALKIGSMEAYRDELAAEILDFKRQVGRPHRPSSE